MYPLDLEFAHITRILEVVQYVKHSNWNPYYATLADKFGRETVDQALSRRFLRLVLDQGSELLEVAVMEPGDPQFEING